MGLCGGWMRGSRPFSVRREPASDPCGPADPRFHSGLQPTDGLHDTDDRFLTGRPPGRHGASRLRMPLGRTALLAPIALRSPRRAPSMLHAARNKWGGGGCELPVTEDSGDRFAYGQRPHWLESWRRARQIHSSIDSPQRRHVRGPFILAISSAKAADRTPAGRAKKPIPMRAISEPTNLPGGV